MPRAIPTLLFCLCLPGFAHAQSPAFENNTDYPGGDYSSSVLKRPDAAECSRICNADARCKAFTFVRPSGDQPLSRCYLKERVARKARSSCCISGLRAGSPEAGLSNSATNAPSTSSSVAPATGKIGGERNPAAPATGLQSAPPQIGARQTFHREPGVDYPGNDYKSFVANPPSDTQCQSACLRDERCKAYSFVRPSDSHPKGRCFLKTSAGQRRVDECCTSGRRLAAGELPSGSRSDTRAGQDIIRDALLKGRCLILKGERVLERATRDVRASLTIHNNPHNEIRRDGRLLSSHIVVDGPSTPLPFTVMNDGRQRRYFNDIRGDVAFNGRDMLIRLTARRPIKAYGPLGGDNTVADGEFVRPNDRAGPGALFRAISEGFNNYVDALGGGGRAEETGEWVPTIALRMNAAADARNRIAFSPGQMDFNFDYGATGVAVRDMDDKIKDQFRAALMPLVQGNGAIARAILSRLENAAYAVLLEDHGKQRAAVSSFGWATPETAGTGAGFGPLRWGARTCMKFEGPPPGTSLNPANPAFGSGAASDSGFRQSTISNIQSARQLDTPERLAVEVVVDRVIGGPITHVSVRELRGTNQQHSWELPAQTSDNRILFDLPRHLNRSLSSFHPNTYDVRLLSGQSGRNAKMERSNIAVIQPVHRVPEVCKAIALDPLARLLLAGESQFHLHNDSNNRSVAGSFVSFRGNRRDIAVPVYESRRGQWYFNDINGTWTAPSAGVTGAKAKIGGSSIPRLSYIEQGTLPCNEDMHFDGQVVLGRRMQIETDGTEIKGYNINDRDILRPDFELKRLNNDGEERWKPEFEYGLALNVDLARNTISATQSSSCFRGHVSASQAASTAPLRLAFSEIGTDLERQLNRAFENLANEWDAHARRQVPAIKSQMGIPERADLSVVRSSIEICYLEGTRVGSSGPVESPVPAPAPSYGPEVRGPQNNEP